MLKRPMLAGKIEDEDLGKLRFPVIASPKIDGIRCLTIDGRAVSRTLKSIPNDYTREMIEAWAGAGFDGELIAGDNFSECSSAIMSRDGAPDFCYWVFDLFEGARTRKPVMLSMPYRDRIAELAAFFEEQKIPPYMQIVPTQTINTLQELETYEADCLARGFEGVMVRDPLGPYKEGRSTFREGWLLKLKRFTDSEAVILSLEEQQHNENEKVTNELGLSKRSSAKAGKVAAGTLGKFIVRDLKTGEEFGIGGGKGLTSALRAEIWANREAYVGKIVKYKFQAFGTKDAPRLPGFLGFRSPEDM
jgi:DNA ligase-1